MNLRHQLRQLRESLSPNRAARNPRKRTHHLSLEKLEDRLAPVVGAFAVPGAVAAGTGFDGVVFLNMVGVGSCSGSLLSTGRDVLTAAHCLTNATGQIDSNSTNVIFNLPGVAPITMNVPRADYFVHPSWRGENNSWDNDIAILRLRTLAPSGPLGLGAERYNIYRGTGEVNQVVTFAGYGTTGTGNTGNNQGGGTKRLGQNRIERLVQANGSALAYDFDNGNANNDLFGRRFGIPNTGLGAAEAMQAPGDSGGPTFVGGQIAGVFSYYSTFGGTEDVLAGLNASFGEFAADTRVSSFTFWIDFVVNGRHDLILDMMTQVAGQDANPDTILLRRTGAFLEIFVNDVFYHRVVHADVGRFIFRGSAAADQLRVPADLGLPFTGTVDGRGGADQLVVLSRANSRTYTVTDTFVDFGGLVGQPSFGYRDLADLQLGAGATDTVNIWSTAAGTPVFVSEAGTVNVGPQGNLALIRAAVSVRNPAGFTALTINNSADSTTRPNVILSATGLTGLAATAAINWVPANLRSLTIHGGNGSNTYSILDTPQSGVAGGLITTLTCGTAVDTVHVRATTGRLAINGNGGQDNVNLNANAGGIAARVDVSNAPGSYTALTVDAAAVPFQYTATLSDSSITFGGPPLLFYVPASLRSLTLRGGTNNNTYNITNTPSSGFAGGVVTTVRGGTGVDAMNVQRTATTGRLVIDGNGGLDNVLLNANVNGIAARVDVSNAPGSYTALTVDAAAVSFQYTATLSDSSITFGGPPLLFYVPASLRSLTLRGGSNNNTYNITNTPSSGFAGGVQTTVNAGLGGDAFIVSSTAAGTTTALNGGDGNDAFIVGDGPGLGGVRGRLRLDGQTGPGGGGFARVNDTVGTVAREYTWNGSSLRWGAVTVEAANLGAFNLIGGLGDDVVAIQDGAAAMPFFLGGGGGANALDYSGYGANVYVNLRTGVATGTGGVSNIQYVLGGPGNDILVGAGGNVLAGGPGRDILIGGATSSVLFGDFFEDLGDDILIAGSTAYDENFDALLAIRDYWAGADDYDTRVANLTTGVGVPLLDASTITYNGGPNLLLGGGGRDLVFIRPDVDIFIDPEEGEMVVPI